MFNIIGNHNLHYIRKIDLLKQLAATLPREEDFQDRTIILDEVRHLENAVIDFPLLSDHDTALFNFKKICLSSNAGSDPPLTPTACKASWLTYSSINYLTLRCTNKMGMLSHYPHTLVSPARDLANIAASTIQKRWRNRLLSKIIREALARGHPHTNPCGQSCLCCRSEAARSSGEWFDTCIVCDLIHIDEIKLNLTKKN